MNIAIAALHGGALTGGLNAVETMKVVATVAAAAAANFLSGSAQIFPYPTSVVQVGQVAYVQRKIHQTRREQCYWCRIW